MKGVEKTAENLKSAVAGETHEFKEMYPDIFTSGQDVPYLTNSTQLNVDKTDNAIEAIMHQNDIQPLYTGGTILHTFMGEKMTNAQACKTLVKKIASVTQLPYF